jgi:hypothetical protein
MRWTPPPEGREEEQIEFSWAGETARHVGTVVHRWLQRIAEDELRGWDTKRVASLTPRFASELNRRGVPVGEVPRSSELVATALTNTLSDERGRWIIGPQVSGRTEYRVRVVSGRSTQTYVMDRLFSDATGAMWIVDYKTGSHQGRDIDAFLDAERDRYAPQMLKYARALGLSSDANLALYMPLLRGWRSWTNS